MKTVPIEVFILENGQYISITNNEHELRKATDPEYAKRSFYPIQGRLMEVSKQDYDELYRADERMRYVKAVEIKKGQLSLDAFFADEDDEATDKGRKQAEEFFDYLIFSIENSLFVNNNFQYKTSAPVEIGSFSEYKGEKTKDVVIITDCEEGNSSLSRMIEYFRANLPFNTRVVNISEYPLKGGCLGCFGCATDGKCVYKDGFDEFLRTKIQTADSMIYAFTVKDHSMGARFKMYDDRQFCNGHRTVTIGMPIGYLVSGSYSVEKNLQNVITARADVGSNFLAGVATDEFDTKGEIDKLIKNLTYALERGYHPPQSFFGIGGMKIFRDLIWLMQGMMKADHKFYKAQGQYDFPQKKRGMMLKMYLVGALISSPKIKAKMGNKMNEGMIAPYKKALKIAEKRILNDSASRGEQI